METVQNISFSVIIPAYNAAKYIRRALDSVRGQSYSNYEVLVTNDGSIDDTEQILKQYTREFPKLPLRFATQANGGIGSARNRAMRSASGNFLAFLDSDDLWRPDKLLRVNNFICTHPNADVIYHDEIEVQINGKSGFRRHHVLKKPYYERLLFEPNPLSTSATVVRHKLAQKVGEFSENEDFNGVEDKDYWLELARAGALFEYLEEVLGEYHRTDTSVSMRIEYHSQHRLNVFEHHLDNLLRERRYEKSYLNWRARCYRAQNLVSTAQACLRTGDWRRAMDLHGKAMRQRPLWWKPYAGLLMAVGRVAIRR